MAEKKKVLFLAPPYMDIYKDILSCLSSMDYDVTWIEDGQVKGNPYNKNDINRNTKTNTEYDEEVNSLWSVKFEKFAEKEEFDYFFAIDGLMVSSFFFEELRRRNPCIITVLYLYDKIERNYELEVFFKYYNRIFTFDKGDSIKYSLNHLPIYWVPSCDADDDIFDIFGMASYNSEERYKVFCYFKSIAQKEKLREYIKLWRPQIKNPFRYVCKYIVYKSLGREMLSLSQLKSDIFTIKSMSPKEFRRKICQSRVIIDTHLPYQDGLTARFMWALGAGKKIITTNESVRSYSFYTPEQIFVLHNNYDGIIEFLKTPFVLSDEEAEIISNYRIDNWIDTLLGNKE